MHGMYVTIRSHRLWGPLFGRGDLSLRDQCDRNRKSQSVGPDSYELPRAQSLCGSMFFTVDDYEVFAV